MEEKETFLLLRNPRILSKMFFEVVLIVVVMKIKI